MITKPCWAVYRRCILERRKTCPKLLLQKHTTPLPNFHSRSRCHIIHHMWQRPAMQELYVWIGFERYLFPDWASLIVDFSTLQSGCSVIKNPIDITCLRHRFCVWEMYISGHPSPAGCGLHRDELKRPTFGFDLTRPGAQTCQHSKGEQLQTA